MQSTNQLLKQAKQHHEDFEWYPTTTEIINAIKANLPDQSLDILDVGAGDGRVLNALTENGKKYAIEKSRSLLSALNADVFVVGTDFHEQTLLDKRCDVVFSNPPYSEYEAWAEKIILEAQAKTVYLVIPRRWQSSIAIADAISLRKAKADVILSTDFLEADRKARAVVDVIKISLARSRVYDRRGEFVANVDPFELWFERNFPLSSDSSVDADNLSLKEKVANELIKSGDIVTTLEQLYQRDFAKLLSAYKAVSQIDESILKELDVNKSVLSGGLRKKVEGLKDKYWRQLFENMDRVTNRLTAQSRSAMFDVLTKNTHVDFTRSNAFAVLEWVVKNANQYYDQQLTDLYGRMIEKANVSLYKSNQKVFKDEDWRYVRQPESLSHFKLEYRVVLERVGGLSTHWLHGTSEISERAAHFLNDLCTVAYNLGFDNWGAERAESFTWRSGAKCVFHFKNSVTGKQEELFEAKAFKNGNLHIRFNQKLMCKMNVEFGRLKGWLKTKEQAAEELDVLSSEVEESFNSNKRLTLDSVLMLGYSQAA